MSALPNPDAMPWPSAVVFDLDGTLADSARSISMALNRALADAGHASLGVATVKTMIGAGPEVLVQRALTALSADNGYKAVRHVTQAFLDNYRQQEHLTTTLFFGVETCLAELHVAGIPMGICTNKPDAFCIALLEDLGIADYFSAIQGSGTGLPHKPDPRPLLNTLRKLGADVGDALYVGDSETDVLTARAAGVPVALVRYGYTTTPADELGADWVVDSLFGLPELTRQAALPPRRSAAS